MRVIVCAKDSIILENEVYKTKLHEGEFSNEQGVRDYAADRKTGRAI